MEDTYKDLEKDIRKAYDTFEEYVLKAQNLPNQFRKPMMAAAIDLLPESIKPYAKAELAAEYMIQAQKAEQDGEHAAAKVYTAVALHYMSQTGIRLDQVLPETAGKDDSSKYIASLFEPAPTYDPKGGK